MIRCEKCGTAAGAGQRFCTDCGEALASEPQSPDGPAWALSAAQLSHQVKSATQASKDALKESLAAMRQSSRQFSGGSAPAPSTPNTSRSFSGGPSARPLLNVQEMEELLQPDEHQMWQSSRFIFNCPFITSNILYAQRIEKTTFLFCPENPELNAFATDQALTAGEQTIEPPIIVFLGGLSAAIRLSGTALATHLAALASGRTSDQVGFTRACRAVGEAVMAGAGSLGPDACTAIRRKWIAPLLEQCDSQVSSVARSIVAATECQVIAHEAGHISMGHTLGSRKSPETSRNQEREADSFAASALGSSVFREYLFVGAALTGILLTWVEAAGGPTTGAGPGDASHPPSRQRFLDLFVSQPSAAEEAAQRFGLTRERLIALLPEK